jgi:hypothetical protein
VLRTDDDIGHVRRIPAEGATTADDEPIGGPPRKNKAGDRGSACLNGTVTLFPMRIRRIPLPSCATLVCVIVEFMDDDDVRLELRQAPDAVVPHVAPGNVRDYQRHTGAWSELDCDLSEGLRQHEAGTGGLGQRDRGSTAVQVVQALWGSAVGPLGRTNYERLGS